jgi:hypothetical protein
MYPTVAPTAVPISRPSTARSPALAWLAKSPVSSKVMSTIFSDLIGAPPRWQQQTIVKNTCKRTML